MRAELKELWRFRELLATMVERELKIRYRNSLLGFFWSLINPLVTVLVLTVVFRFFYGNDTPNFTAYILAAYLPYMFFQFAILDSAQSILINAPLIRKIYFPREILPLASVIGNFIHFMLALGVFFVYLLCVYLLFPEINPFQTGALMLPVLLVLGFAFAAGCGLIVSALNTFYEDVKYLVSVLLYLMFFLCPIFYFIENVIYAPQIPEEYRAVVYYVYTSNPLANLCVMFRKFLLAPQPVNVNGVRMEATPIDWMMFGVTAATCFGILILGYHVFNRMKWRFVERP